MYAQKAEAINPREGRLQFSRGKMATLKTLNVGDYIVLDFRNSRGIRIERGKNITLKEVTMWSLPSIGVISRFMDGDNYFSYTIERGPMPEGAEVPRLLSISADGFNYAYARKGPIVENCDFSFMGDDAVNLHGIAFYVAQVKDDMLYLIRPYIGESFTSIVNSGDVAMSIAPDTFDVKDRAFIQSFELEPSASKDLLEIAEEIWQSKAVKSGRISVYAMQVDKHAMSVEAGDFIEIPAIAAPNYTIRNNHFRDHRGRGLRLMSSNGLVEGNTLENIKQSAISIGSEMTFYREAGWVENVTILNNTIRDVGFDPVMHLSGTHVPGAISLFHRGATPETARPNMHIRAINILRNTIEEVGGPAIHINQSEDVYVFGNTISGSNLLSQSSTGSDYDLDTTQPISIDFSKDIHVYPAPSVNP
ncbi:MAG: alpha-mannosidase [Puniceicoccaceae bacterium]|nr:alpha-mannosidase [Puniceicoccaceae bacterium]|tara:strand:- start:8138 stop:9394 length:1257 start_codon:yes stop_codon:yes gene_type:complete